VGSRVIDGSDQLDLHVLPLWAAFLNEIRVEHGLTDVTSEVEMLRRRLRRQSEDAQCAPCGVYVTAQCCFGVGRRIRGHDVEPAGEIQGRPAGPDGPRADHRNPTHGFVQRHQPFPRSTWRALSVTDIRRSSEIGQCIAPELSLNYS
jgi:hypothetical protein